MLLGYIFGIDEGGDTNALSPTLFCTDVLRSAVAYKCPYTIGRLNPRQSNDTSECNHRTMPYKGGGKKRGFAHTRLELYFFRNKNGSQLQIQGQ